MGGVAEWDPLATNVWTYYSNSGFASIFFFFVVSLKLTAIFYVEHARSVIKLRFVLPGEHLGT